MSLETKNTDQIKIVLCMIVKNESKIIRRCFDSCKDIKWHTYLF